MANGKLHRRDFLKLVGTGLVAVPTLNGLPTLAEKLVAPKQRRVTLASVDVPDEGQLIQSLEAELRALFEGREMALDFRRLADDGTENFRIQINADEYYPVASAFKSWLVLYYFLNTPPDEWQTDSMSLVYRVAVFSNNRATGSLIYEMGGRVPGDGNPIEKFNDFILNTLQLENGLYSWNWEGAPTYGMYDERFAPTQSRYIRIRGGEEGVSNISTAEDLARGYEWISRARERPEWSDPDFQQAINAARELLSIPANGYLSPIEQVVNSGYIGKDGTLPLGDLPNIGRVINDAGIIRVPTGEFLIGFMSAGENESSTRPALEKVIDGMRRFEEMYHPSYLTYINGESHPVYEDGYNYGFVRRREIKLYYEPDVNAEQIDNPVRRNTVFGMMYLMQGALVRFLPVDDEWAEVIRDDEEDNIFMGTDWKSSFGDANWIAKPPRNIYVRLEDLLVIGRDHFAGINYISNAAEGTDKYIILDVPRRQLTLFEGITPILKTPVVLNMEATPSGRLYVNRRLLARNMPYYPGVPYTNFLHDGGTLNTGGFALHGAPWHRWSETVTRRETLRRYSAGCINLPNWERTIGEYTLPVDEFVFRWIGDFPNPASDRHYIPPNYTPVLIFSHYNIYQDLFNFPAPTSVRYSGYNWGDVLELIDATEVTAPDSFFEPTLL